MDSQADIVYAVHSFSAENPYGLDLSSPLAQLTLGRYVAGMRSRSKLAKLSKSLSAMTCLATAGIRFA